MLFAKVITVPVLVPIAISRSQTYYILVTYFYSCIHLQIHENIVTVKVMLETLYDFEIKSEKCL